MSLTRIGKIISLLLIIAILWSARSTVLDLLRTIQSEMWPRTAAELTFVGRDFHRSVRDDEKIVHYRYRVDGTEYSGGRISFSRRMRWEIHEAEKMAESFRANEQLEVAFNPAAPTVSVLLPGGSRWPNALFLMMQLSLVVVFAWLLLRSESRKT